MKTKKDAQQVGAPDPNLKNSPIIEETDYDFDVKGQEMPRATQCYFNNVAYEDGGFVCSGNELLTCQKGAWVRAGSCDPDNP